MTSPCRASGEGLRALALNPEKVLSSSHSMICSSLYWPESFSVASTGSQARANSV